MTRYEWVKYQNMKMFNRSDDEGKRALVSKQYDMLTKAWDKNDELSHELIIAKKKIRKLEGKDG